MILRLVGRWVRLLDTGPRMAGRRTC